MFVNYKYKKDLKIGSRLPLLFLIVINFPCVIGVSILEWQKLYYQK
jgi:hypothetical protein